MHVSGYPGYAVGQYCQIDKLALLVSGGTPRSRFPRVRGVLLLGSGGEEMIVRYEAWRVRSWGSTAACNLVCDVRIPALFWFTNFPLL